MHLQPGMVKFSELILGLGVVPWLFEEVVHFKQITIIDLHIVIKARIEVIVEVVVR